MKLRSLILNTAILFFSSFISFVSVCPASDDDMHVLRMFYEEKDLVETPTRKLKILSHVAENITVITADDIEEMNAHTLSEILFGVPGVQVNFQGGPGGTSMTSIQGSEFNHSIIMIDGMVINNLSDNFADASAIPAQIIKRIELIKGPASSTWGSSLGGVINVITKEGAGYRSTVGGLFSGSYGEGKTGDSRAEFSGKRQKLSYYLYGGNFSSDALPRTEGFHWNNLHSKLKWDISPDLSMGYSLFYTKGSRNEGDLSALDISLKDKSEYLYAALSMNYSITDSAGMNASLRLGRQNVFHTITSLSSGQEVDASHYHDRSRGGSLKFSWKDSIHDVVSGFDYDYGELESDAIAGRKQSVERWAVYINDTLDIAKVAFTPGLRYDHTSTSGSILSPSLGVTYNLDSGTVLRGYASRGFSTPPLSARYGTSFFFLPNPDLRMEKVFSMQGGIESTALKYLWVKAMVFRHDIRDAIFVEVRESHGQAVNKEKQRREGFEIEFKTLPVKNISLSAGITYTDSKNRDTGDVLKNVARYSYDVGIHYNDNRHIRALLKGHYMWWNASPDINAKYTAMLWDLSITKKLAYANKKAEFFVTAHNIFNGSQYLQEVFKNPARWVEAGLRFKL